MGAFNVYGRFMVSCHGDSSLTLYKIHVTGRKAEAEMKAEGMPVSIARLDLHQHVLMRTCEKHHRTFCDCCKERGDIWYSCSSPDCGYYFCPECAGVGVGVVGEKEGEEVEEEGEEGGVGGDEEVYGGDEEEWGITFNGGLGVMEIDGGTEDLKAPFCRSSIK